MTLTATIAVLGLCSALYTAPNEPSPNRVRISRLSLLSVEICVHEHKYREIKQDIRSPSESFIRGKRLHVPKETIDHKLTRPIDTKSQRGR
jgi:hypothetical protein